LVEMKKNRTSWVFFTGRSETANAAGIPRSSTNTVENTVAITEFTRYGPTPAAKTPSYCSSVGSKMIFGVVV